MHRALELQWQGEALFGGRRCSAGAQDPQTHGHLPGGAAGPGGESPQAGAGFRQHKAVTLPHQAAVGGALQAVATRPDEAVQAAAQEAQLGVDVPRVAHGAGAACDGQFDLVGGGVRPGGEGLQLQAVAGRRGGTAAAEHGGIAVGLCGVRGGIGGLFHHQVGHRRARQAAAEPDGEPFAAAAAHLGGAASQELLQSPLQGCGQGVISQGHPRQLRVHQHLPFTTAECVNPLARALAIGRGQLQPQGGVHALAAVLLQLHLGHRRHAGADGHHRGGRHHRRLPFHGELAVEGACAGEAEGEGTGQLQVAGGVEAGGQATAGRQVWDAGYRCHTLHPTGAPCAAVLACSRVVAQPQLPLALAQAHLGGTAAQIQRGLAGLQQPGLLAGVAGRGAQGHVEAALQLGAPDGHSSLQLQAQAGGVLLQAQADAGGGAQGAATAVVGAVPVDHRCVLSQGSAICRQGAVDPKPGAAHNAQLQATGQGGARQRADGAEPTAWAAAIEPLLAQHQPEVEASGADAEVVAADARLAIGHGHHQLVGAHGGAIAQQHGLIRQALQRQAALQCQPVADAQTHLPADAALLALHRQGGAAARDGDRPLQRFAPAAEHHLQVFSLEADAGQAAQGDLAAAAEGIALAGRCTGRIQPFQHQGAAPPLQAGPQSPEAEAPRQVGDADLQAAGLAGAAGGRTGPHREITAHGAQGGQGEGGLAQLQALTPHPIAEGDPTRGRGEPGGHLHIDGLIQVVHLKPRPARQADLTAEALQLNAAFPIEGIAAAAQQHQAEAGIRDAQVRGR